MEKNFIATVKIGSKGQIVIPKEVREMFGMKAGDSLIILADAEKGILLQKSENLNNIVNSIVDGIKRGEENDSPEG